MEEKIYDLIILGGGPASMSAGVYASQMKLDTLLIEKETFGGQIATTSLVINYLGFEKITGEDLSEKMHKHLETTSTQIVKEEVTKTELGGDIKVVYTHGNCYKAKAVIIGIGTQVRKLGVDNEQFYLKKGLSYTTLKDRDAFENKVVAIVGGGNSAIEDAMYLAEKCKKVYIVHRRQEFRADAKVVSDLHTAIKNNGNIELVLDSKPHSIVGNEKVEKFCVEHIPTGEIKELTLDGIFVCIGRGADTDIIDDGIEKDQSGYIVTDTYMRTNLDRVYAVGDIRTTPLRQIATAVADGSIAAVTAFNDIKRK